MMGREGISSGEVWLTGRSDFVLVGEVCGFGFFLLEISERIRLKPLAQMKPLNFNLDIVPDVLQPRLFDDVCIFRQSGSCP